MKNQKKHLKQRITVVALLIVAAITLTFCTKNDQVLNPNAPASPSQSVPNTDTVYSIKVANGPSFTGSGSSFTLDPMWNNVPKLTVAVTVPDVEGPNSGSNGFNGFIGNSTNVTMQSLYDANNIYFLIQWNEAQGNMESSPWYFNPATRRWGQAGAAPTYDVNGVNTLQSFVSDQFDMMFNINNSCNGFRTQSCYGMCHQNVPISVMDTNTGKITTTGINAMWTASPNEKTDCWRARMYQVMSANQALDYYFDWNGGINTGNAIHADQTFPNGGNPPAYSSNASTNGAGGLSNKQTLTITGTSTKESIPLWVKKPGSTYTNAALLPSDTAGGAAFKVIAVDSTGVLTLSDNSTIDPNSGTAYQIVGTSIGTNDQTTWIPGKIIAPYTGGEGDVTANARWTGSGWQLMLKRALKTADCATEQDVDFSTLQDQPFGIGLMFQPMGSMNAADNEHAIMPGLLLHFNK